MKLNYFNMLIVKKKIDMVTLLVRSVLVQDPLKYILY
jgi:hypothetical protein